MKSRWWNCAALLIAIGFFVLPGCKGGAALPMEDTEPVQGDPEADMEVPDP